MLRELPKTAQAGFTTVLGQAEETYEDLAGRGKDLVERIRSQKATEDLVTQAKTTVSAAAANANQPVKDLYEVGEIPPLGHVPERMHAWTIRQRAVQRGQRVQVPEPLGRPWAAAGL